MRLIGLISLLLIVPALEAEVYKWVDADGVIHFTDQPQAGAERFELSEPTVYTPPLATRPQAAKAQPEPLEPPPGYESLHILSPLNDESVRSNEGRVSVAVQLSPSLKSGHKFRVYMDGEEISSGLTTSSIQLMNVDRGTHTLHAIVVDSVGKELIRSETTTFHLLRYFSR